MAQTVMRCTASNYCAPKLGRKYIYKYGLDESLVRRSPVKLINVHNKEKLIAAKNAGVDLSSSYAHRHFKINRNQVRLFQHNMGFTKLPKLTLRNCRYKDNMYIDSLFGAGEGVGEGEETEMNINDTDIYGITSMYHGDIKCAPYGPFTANRYVGDGGKKHSRKFGYYEPGTKNPVTKKVETEQDWHEWRRALVLAVHRSKWKNGRYCGELVDYFSNRIHDFPDDYMAMVHKGIPSFKDGLYLQCNCCNCLSYIPLEFAKGTMAEDITKSEVCDFLEAFMNNYADPESTVDDPSDPDSWEIDLDVSRWGYNVQGIGYAFDQCKFMCFNCGQSIFSTSWMEPLEYSKFIDLVRNEYGIHAIDLEMFSKMMYLDTPPPAELVEASKLHSKKSNEGTYRALKRMDRIFLNTNFSVDRKDGYTGLLNTPEYKNVFIASKQALSKSPLGVMELEEIVLMTEFASMCNNHVNFHPSSINSLHAIENGYYYTLSSAWFNDLDTTPWGCVVDDTTIPLYMANPGRDFPELDPGTEMFFISPLWDRIPEAQKFSDCVATMVSGSDKPVLWDRKFSEVASRHGSIDLHGNRLHVKTIRCTEHMAIISLSPLSGEHPKRMIKAKSTLWVYLPKLSFNAFCNSLGIIGDHWELQEIDTEMCFRVVLHCLTGQKSVESILTYIAGLVSTRYIAGGKTVDLSSMAIRDGMPELIYALLILDNQKRVAQWTSAMFTHHVNIAGLRKNLYDTLLAIMLRATKTLDPAVHSKLENMVTRKSTTLFMRDKMLMEHHQTTDFNSIAPFVVVDGVYGCEEVEIPVPMNACNHHSRRCCHKKGFKTCPCCNLYHKDSTQYCSCCFDKEREHHACHHDCKVTHFCNVRLKFGACHHVGRCKCCGTKSCTPVCPCCSKEPPLTGQETKSPQDATNGEVAMEFFKPITSKTTKNLVEQAKKLKQEKEHHTEDYRAPVNQPLPGVEEVLSKLGVTQRQGQPSRLENRAGIILNDDPYAGFEQTESPVTIDGVDASDGASDYHTETFDVSDPPGTSPDFNAGPTQMRSSDWFPPPNIQGCPVVIPTSQAPMPHTPFTSARVRPFLGPPVEIPLQDKTEGHPGTVNLEHASQSNQPYDLIAPDTPETTQHPMFLPQVGRPHGPRKSSDDTTTTRLGVQNRLTAEEKGKRKLNDKELEEMKRKSKIIVAPSERLNLGTPRTVLKPQQQPPPKDLSPEQINQSSRINVPPASEEGGVEHVEKSTHPPTISEAVLVQPSLVTEEDSPGLEPVVHSTTTKTSNVTGPRIVRQSVSSSSKPFAAQPGKTVKKILIGDEYMHLRTIRHLTKPIDLFVFSDQGVYCLYMPVHGVRRLPTTPQNKDNIKDPVTVSFACFYHCLERSGVIKVSTCMLEYGPNESHSLDEIIEIGKQLPVNMVVLTGSEAVLLRNTDMETTYIVIAHSSAFHTPITMGHWCLMRSFELAPGPMPDGYWDNNDMRKLLSGDPAFDTFKVTQEEWNRVNRAFITLRIENRELYGTEAPTQLRIVQESNEWYLTNGLIHDIQLGFIKLNVTEQQAEFLLKCINQSKKNLEVSNLVTSYDSNSELAVKIDAKWNDICKTIHDTIISYQSDEESVKTRIPVNIPGGIQKVPDVAKLMTKSLDMVLVDYYDNTKELLSIYMSSGNKLICCQPKRVTCVTIFKISMGSLIRQLCQIKLALNNIRNVPSCKVIRNVSGIAGSGKSTYITKNLANPSNGFISKLRGPVLKQQKTGFKFTATLEKYLATDLKTINLVIDEASLLDDVDFVSALKLPNMRLYLFSDLKQIGVVDFSSTPGTRHSMSLPEIVGNIECWNHTYRYGNPYATEILARIYPNLDVKSAHPTTYSLHKTSNFHDIKELVTQHHIDTVYTFHDAIQRRANDIVGDRVPVLKVHANQGSEANRVMLLYWGEQEFPSGILNNILYITTALTRCRDHMLVVTNFNCVENIKQIIDNAHSIGSSSSLGDLFDVDTLTLNRNPTETEWAIITNLCAKFDVECQRVGGALEMSFSCRGAIVSYQCQINKPITGKTFISNAILATGKGKVREVLRRLQIELEDDCETSRLPDTEFFDTSDQPLPNISDEEPQRCVRFAMSLRAWSKLIKLAKAALPNQLCHADLQLKIQGENWRVKIFDGCSLFCGFRFTNEFNQQCHISSAHALVETFMSTITGHIRVVMGPDRMVSSILSFLEDSDDTIHGDPRLTLYTISERVGNIMSYVINSGSDPHFHPGQSFKTRNKPLVDRYNKEYSAKVFVVTHEMVNILLVPGEVVTTYPKKLVVSDLNELIRYQSGICGAEERVEANLTNKLLMDNLLTRKIRVDYQYQKTVHLPSSSYHRFGPELFEFVNNKTVVELTNSSMDDTIACPVNAIGLVVLKKVFGIDSLVVSGVDALTVSSQDFEEYRIPMNELDAIGMTHMRSVFSDKLRAIQNLMEGTDKPTPEMRERLNYLEQRYVFVTQEPHTDSVFYGLGACVKPNYQHVYFVKHVGYSSHITDFGCGEWLVGDNGRPLHPVTIDYIELFSFGHFSLCKMVSEVPRIMVSLSNAQKKDLLHFTNRQCTMPVVSISSHIYKSVLSRALFSEVSINTLVTYTRSLLSTQIYTNAGVVPKFGGSLDDAYYVALVCKNIADRNRNFINSIHQFTNTNSIDDVSVFTTIKSIILSILNDPQTGLLSEVAKEVIGSLMNGAEKLNEIASQILDSEVIQIHESVKFLYRSGDLPQVAEGHAPIQTGPNTFVNRADGSMQPIHKWRESKRKQATPSFMNNGTLLGHYAHIHGTNDPRVMDHARTNYPAEFRELNEYMLRRIRMGKLWTIQTVIGAFDRMKFLTSSSHKHEAVTVSQFHDCQSGELSNGKLKQLNLLKENQPRLTEKEHNLLKIKFPIPLAKLRAAGFKVRRQFTCIGTLCYACQLCTPRVKRQHTIKLGEINELIRMVLDVNPRSLFSGCSAYVAAALHLYSETGLERLMIDRTIRSMLKTMSEMEYQQFVIILGLTSTEGVKCVGKLMNKEQFDEAPGETVYETIAIQLHQMLLPRLPSQQQKPLGEYQILLIVTHTITDAGHVSDDSYDDSYNTDDSSTSSSDDDSGPEDIDADQHSDYSSCHNDDLSPFEPSDTEDFHSADEGTDQDPVHIHPQCEQRHSGQEGLAVFNAVPSTTNLDILAEVEIKLDLFKDHSVVTAPTSDVQPILTETNEPSTMDTSEALAPSEDCSTKLNKESTPVSQKSDINSDNTRAVSIVRDWSNRVSKWSPKTAHALEDAAHCCPDGIPEEILETIIQIARLEAKTIEAGIRIHQRLSTFNKNEPVVKDILEGFVDYGPGLNKERELADIINVMNNLIAVVNPASMTTASVPITEIGNQAIECTPEKIMDSMTTQDHGESNSVPQRAPERTLTNPIASGSNSAVNCEVLSESSRELVSASQIVQAMASMPLQVTEPFEVESSCEAHSVDTAELIAHSDVNEGNVVEAQKFQESTGEHQISTINTQPLTKQLNVNSCESGSSTIIAAQSVHPTAQMEKIGQKVTSVESIANAVAPVRHPPSKKPHPKVGCRSTKTARWNRALYRTGRSSKKAITPTSSHAPPNVVCTVSLPVNLKQDPHQAMTPICQVESVVDSPLNLPTENRGQSIIPNVPPSPVNESLISEPDSVFDSDALSGKGSSLLDICNLMELDHRQEPVEGYELSEQWHASEQPIEVKVAEREIIGHALSHPPVQTIDLKTEPIFTTHHHPQMNTEVVNLLEQVNPQTQNDTLGATIFDTTTVDTWPPLPTQQIPASPNPEINSTHQLLVSTSYSQVLKKNIGIVNETNIDAQASVQEHLISDSVGSYEHPPIVDNPSPVVTNTSLLQLVQGESRWAQFLSRVGNTINLGSDPTSFSPNTIIGDETAEGQSVTKFDEEVEGKLQSMVKEFDYTMSELSTELMPISHNIDSEEATGSQRLTDGYNNRATERMKLMMEGLYKLSLRGLTTGNSTNTGNVYQIRGSEEVTHQHSSGTVSTVNPTVCVLMSGSRGDYQPMYCIVMAIHNFTRVTVICPRDVPFNFPKNVQIIHYTETYSTLHNAFGSILKVPITEIYKHLLRVLISTANTEFDYVFSMFFGPEANLIKYRKAHYKIVPQTSEAPIPSWMELRDNLQDITAKPYKKKPIVVWAVPTGLAPSKPNMGLPLCTELFTVGNVENVVMDFAMESNSKLTIFTLGSMRTIKFQTLLMETLQTEPGPILIVLGGNVGVIKKPLQRNNTPLEITHMSRSADTLVVNSVNYYAISRFVKKFICHGGCGTLITSAICQADVVVHPIAYDQSSNKELINSFTSLRVDLMQEWETFHHSLSLLLNVAEIPAPPTLRLPTLEEVEILDDTPPSVVHTMKLRFTGANVFEVLQTHTKEDCVLRSLLSCGFDERTNIAVQQSYKTVMDCLPLMDVTSILVTGMLAKINVLIAMDGIAVELNMGSPNTANLLINSDGSHCNVMECEATTLHIGTTTVAWRNYWPDIDMTNKAKVLRGISGLMRGIKTDHKDPYIIANRDILSETRNFTIKSSLITAYRKSNPILYNCFETCSGGWKSSVDLMPYYTWHVWTEVGVVCAISLMNQLDGGSALFHGTKTTLHAVMAVRKSAMRLHPTSLVNLPTTYCKVSCLNQSTKEYCHSMGLLVTHVGGLNSEKLYIHNSNNREHHYEQERAIILSAGKIEIVPANIPKDWLNYFVKSSNHPRMRIVKGEPRFYFELQQDLTEFERTVTARAGKTLFCMELDDTLGILQVGVNSANMSSMTRANQHMITSLMIPTVTDSGAPQFRYCAIQEDKQLPTVSTIPKILELLEINRTHWLSRKIMLFLEHNNITESNPLTLVEDHIPIDVVNESVSRDITFWKSYMIIGINCAVYHIVHRGSGMHDQNLHSLSGQVEKDLYKFEDKFKLVPKQPVTKTPADVNDVISNITALGPMPNPPMLLPVQDFELNEIHTTYYIDVNGYLEVASESIDELPDAKTIDYWDNFGFQTPQVVLPLNRKFVIESRVSPSKIQVSLKQALEEFPAIARPSMTNSAFEELNSVSNRQGAFTDYTVKDKKGNNKNFNREIELATFISNYFVPEFEKMSINYQQLQISIDPVKSIQWAKAHNNPKRVVQDLKELLDLGWESKPVTGIQVHAKIEQTTKMSKLSRWFNEVVSRSILAGSYALACIMSPIFKEVKERFKECLVDKVKYVDGLTPTEINEYIIRFGDVQYFVEDDLEAQDRQTNSDIIWLEFRIYQLLGVESAVLEFYRDCHDKWSWRGRGTSGVGELMRLTGQTTTAIGNAITNLVVHNRFYSKNEYHIKFLLFLGDDIVIATDRLLDVKNHGTITKEVYNMVSKVMQRERVGGFLSMVIHSFQGYAEICPWYRRCRHRYSVSNYTHTGLIGTEKHNQRTLSYCFMLGPFSECNKIAQSINPRVIIPNWYNMSAAVQANSVYDNTSDQQVVHTIGYLLSMMANRKIFNYTAEVFAK